MQEEPKQVFFHDLGASTIFTIGYYCYFGFAVLIVACMAIITVLGFVVAPGEVLGKISFSSIFTIPFVIIYVFVVPVGFTLQLLIGAWIGKKITRRMDWGKLDL